MKKLAAIFLLFTLSCNVPKQEFSGSKSIDLNNTFKNYWFDGMAEINTYNIKQFRYGSPREGNGVLIYVTEDFLPNVQVKANQKSRNTHTIIKLNRTKNFLTGI